MKSRYVCLPCLLRYGRQTGSATSAAQRDTLSSLVKSATWPAYGPAAQRRTITQQGQNAPGRFRKISVRKALITKVASHDAGGQPLLTSLQNRPSHRNFSLTPGETWELSARHREEMLALKGLMSLMKGFAHTHLQQEKLHRLPMKALLEKMNDAEPLPPRWNQALQDTFQETNSLEALKQLNQITAHVKSGQGTVERESEKILLNKLGIVQVGVEEQIVPDQDLSASERVSKREPTLAKYQAGGDKAAADEDEAGVPNMDTRNMQSLTAKDAVLEPLELGEVNVPKLSFDLSRVLFNPGVYQLQDPRSRVYNFDPYLQRVMPVTEFNFDALNPYITSSQDENLKNLAVQNEKRYIGSSSSMTSVLQHFHFLLSSWRTLNVDSLSRGFQVETMNFTRIHRSPSAVFLRWRDGVYAVDADKEFDSANVLMSLGHSMEKLVTLEKDDYEQFRKSSVPSQPEREPKPEQYHYGGLAKFLLRSQLDAHDPRLPGTGMFDLKTRAVVGVRMILSEYEKGLGYQIKNRQGTWESYEREYYDMMRAAFLKYSLQVRMGRMDGVFVTYHNVESIFGFQYIALPEMDLALHGQTNRSLGDQEFAFSIKLLSDIFDRVTKTFPQQSVRFHFETRESTAEVKQPVHRMYIFAEAMSEDEIQAIQKSNQEDIAAFEQELRNPVQYSLESTGERGDALQDKQSAHEDNAANVDFLESLQDLDLDALTQTSSEPIAVQSGVETSAQPKNPVIGFELVVRSLVNGKPVIRPEKITSEDQWTMQYNLVPMKEGQAEVKYNLCKFRRKNALRDARGEGQTTMNSYFQNLLYMSEEGAKWRRKQDEMDARRERIVLYGGSDRKHTSADS